MASWFGDCQYSDEMRIMAVFAAISEYWWPWLAGGKRDDQSWRATILHQSSIVAIGPWFVINDQ